MIIIERIVIKVGPTYIKIPCGVDGTVTPTQYNIHKFLRKNLTQYAFNPRMKVWEVEHRYFTYVKKEQSLYLPRHTLPLLLEELMRSGAVYDMEPIAYYPTDTVDIPLDKNYSDKPGQSEYISFLTDTTKSMRALAAGTGTGKTYMAIKAASLLGHRTFILTQGLIDQWEQNVLKHTLLLPDEICIIQGHQAMKKFSSPDYQPVPVYIASIGTMRSLIVNQDKYKKYLTVDKLFKKLRIGTKITDECHLNFGTNSMIDLRTRVKNNIYLSATYSRSDNDGKKIFSITFPDTIKFGEGKTKKYTDVYAYSYSFGDIEPKRVLTPMGYNQAKYEKYIYKRSTKLQSYIDTILNLVQSHYINKRESGQKLVIFCGTVAMCNYVKEGIAKRFAQHDLYNSIYISDTDESILAKADILVSTPGSLGTGNDIPHLKTVINTCSFSADGLNRQIFGRLREQPYTTEFIYIYNTAVMSQILHHRTRKNIYTSIAKSYQEYAL